MTDLLPAVRTRSDVVAFVETPTPPPSPLPAPPKALDRAALAAGGTAFSLFMATGVAADTGIDVAVPPLATATAVAVLAMGVLKATADRRRSVR